MEIRFDGKTALVTGGSRGIGYACAQTLLDSGARVVIVGVGGAEVAEAEKKLAADLQQPAGGAVKGYEFDVADVPAIPGFVTRVREEVGEIDVLVQAAGLLRGGPAVDLTEAEWDQVLDVNAKGLFFMLQAVAVQSMIPRRTGAVVNFSSIAGIRGMREPLCSQHYSASKGAVVQITRQAAVEWAKYGIRANAVAPGGVNTFASPAVGGPPAGVPANAQPPASAESAAGPAGPPPDLLEPIPLKRLVEPWEVAASVAFLASDKAAMITGQVLVIDGGGSVVGY
jgi:NAD(P)-dependent dehydrogenase (short-subunit alcohol dehydrogenase family)